MNADEIRAMDSVASRSNKAFMLEFVAQNRGYVLKALNELERERERTDYEWDELIALGR